MTLLSVAGILITLYLFEYTSYFSSLTELAGQQLATRFDPKELLLLFFDELKLLCLIFLSGFTLFAPCLCGLVALYNGFLTGFCVICFGIHFSRGDIKDQTFVLLCAVGILLLTLFICAEAKAVSFSGTLKYAAPDLSSLLRRRETGRYIVTFLLLCCFIFFTVAAKYYIPQI